MTYFRKRDPNRPEKVDPKDVPISKEEALAIAEIADIWPGGLGEALVKCETTKRGYKKDPSFDIFNKSYVPGPDVLLCPVMKVKQMRGYPNDYGKHLSVWRSIRNAYAKVLGVDLKEAHDRYNDDLRNNPKAVSVVFRQYAHETQ